MKVVTYGPGGYDPDAPDNNVVGERSTSEEPTPDPDGFLLACFEQFGKGPTRQFLRDYADVQVGLRQSDWAMVRNALDDALSNGDLGQDGYDTVQALLDEHHIPDPG